MDINIDFYKIIVFGFYRLAVITKLLRRNLKSI